MSAPDPTRTVVALSDSHVGDPRYDSRFDEALEDLRTLEALAFLHGGDLVDRPRAELVTRAVAGLDRLPAPWHGVPGNHDLQFGGEATDTAAWGAAADQPSRTHVADLGPFAVACLYPRAVGEDDVTMLVGDEQLAALDASLGAATKPCLVLSHAPLRGTVRGAPEYYDSTMPHFVVTPDDRVREVLSRHAGAIAWISGHTHSDPSAPDWCKAEPLSRGRTIAAISIPALAFTGLEPSSDGSDPLLSLAITVLDDDVEVRVRDHRARTWRGEPRRVRVG